MMKLLSVDNVKTRKGELQGYLTAVLHLAPHTLSGSNMCPKASKGCSAACLNTAGKGVNPHIQLSRVKRTQSYLSDREGFLKTLRNDLGRWARKAAREHLKPAARLNATSDQPRLAMRMADEFPGIQFYDYTKIKEVFEWPWPDNYYATFSRSETNADECLEVLGLGFNVAAVFENRPPYYKGYEVLNGDESDLRFLDKRGCIVGLTAKGKGKHDRTGFVIRDIAMGNAEIVRCACGVALSQSASEWAKEHGVEKPPRCVECLELVFERRPKMLQSLRAAVQGIVPQPMQARNPLDERILAAVRDQDLHTFALLTDEFHDVGNGLIPRLHHLVAAGELTNPPGGSPVRYYIPGTVPTDGLPKDRASLEPSCEECGGPRMAGSLKRCLRCRTGKAKKTDSSAEPKKRRGRKPQPCLVCGGEREAGSSKVCPDCPANTKCIEAVDTEASENGLETLTHTNGHSSPGNVSITIHCDDLFTAAPAERGLIEGIIQLVQQYQANTAQPIDARFIAVPRDAAGLSEDK